MRILDKRRKYYLILDCETATMPYANKYEGVQKQKISIAKPLIYDLGWQIVDRNGNIYAKENFLITEIFSVPSVFNTAYYKEKRPLYIKMLNNGEITLTNWQSASNLLAEDMALCESVGAYNSMFDFKKAIPFTELYIKMLYSPRYAEWEEMQNKFIDIIANEKYEKPTDKVFEPNLFSFRDIKYNLFDIWGLACRYLLNNNDYKDFCIQNELYTASRKYFKTSAETAFQFLQNQFDFVESHTALDDAIIESQIFAQISKKTKNKWELGIIYFPFRELGKVADYEELAVI